MYASRVPETPADPEGATVVDAAVFEHDRSALLLDDPVFGFPDGSLFPAAVE
jgi:hypothetical protein